MSQKREEVVCASCGEPMWKKALRCPACGTTNPLQERKSLEDMIGLRGAMLLLVIASVTLVVLGVWLTYELVALGRVNPLLLGAGGLMVLVGIGATIARRFRP